MPIKQRKLCSVNQNLKANDSYLCKSVELLVSCFFVDFSLTGNRLATNILFFCLIERTKIGAGCRGLDDELSEGPLETSELGPSFTETSGSPPLAQLSSAAFITTLET